MEVFYKIKIELILLIIIFLSFLFSFAFDISLHNFFLNFNNDIENLYIKEFFIKITSLGSSLWYFSISIFFFLFYFFNKKLALIKIKNLDKKINFFISSFFYLLIVGVLTQVLKHIVGRPRPNHTNFEDPFDFNFFNLESNYHSFPSGHSSTIFMVCLIFGAVLPRLKYYFFVLATVVAFSRVVVGAHFFTDIIAGALLALVVYKFLNKILVKKYSRFLFDEIIFKNNGHLYHALLFLLGFCLFLTIGPSLDLYVANFFYLGSSQFFLQSYDILSILFREIFLPTILIYMLVLPILNKYIKIEKIFFGYKFLIKEIILIWFSLLFSVVVFVNLILKNLWGRARPGDILELGGKENFTPWYTLSKSCETNCSFVSGDASVGFAVVILYLITKKKFFLYLSLVFGFILGFIRILAGGHFLSDVVFSGVIIIVLNIIIFEVYKKYYE